MSARDRPRLRRPARHYRLIDLDNQDDAWHAVVVKAAFYDQFIALSGQLRIVAREPGEVRFGE